MQIISNGSSALNRNGKLEISDCVFENVSKDYCHSCAVVVTGMYQENMILKNNIVKGEGEIDPNRTNGTFVIYPMGNIAVSMDGADLYTAFTKYKAANYNEMAAHLAAGANHVVLTDDVTLDGDFAAPADKTFTLVLNDHCLTCSHTNSLMATSGELIVENGTIKNVSAQANQAGVHITENGKAKFTYVDFETGQSMFKVGDSAYLKLYHCNVTAGSYGVTTNASSLPQNPEIYIQYCNLTCDDPVFVNVPCKLTIYDSKLTGRMHGLVVRGGTAKVMRNTITLDYPGENAADFEGMAHYFDSRNWQSGNAVNLAAVTIGNKGTSAYQYPTSLTIKNNTIQCVGQSADYFPAMYVIANQGEGLGVSITEQTGMQYISNVGPVVYDKMAGAESSNITVNNVEVTVE